ncbi:MAG: sporulation protein YunB, partial [Eubacterium sp.]|nr:sporulation protein YunB [Eubacterium sp.]
NEYIDEITSGIIAEKNLKYTDLYTLTQNENEISSIEINSLLVNEICSETAHRLSEALNNTEIRKIPLSLGLITGFRILSNYGPKINVRLMPMGSARADWETALTDSGINRVNYKVYLNIEASVKIISPLSSRPMEITRKYMLADITFTGAVPDTYLQVK